MTLDDVARTLGYLVLGAAMIWALAGLGASVLTFFFKRWLRKAIKGED